MGCEGASWSFHGRARAAVGRSRAIAFLPCWVPCGSCMVKWSVVGEGGHPAADPCSLHTRSSVRICNSLACTCRRDKGKGGLASSVVPGECRALMALAGRLRQRRMEKGWSASELARRAGIARSHVSRIESGESARPSADVLQRLALALETSVADLLEQPEAVSVAELPVSLRRLAERDQLPTEDVAMLAAIRYRGEQPRTMAGWAFVLEAVRLAILDPADDAEDS